MGNLLGYIGSTVHQNLTTLQNVNRHVFFWRTRCSRQCIATNKHHDDTLDFIIGGPFGYNAHEGEQLGLHLNIVSEVSGFVLCILLFFYSCYFSILYFLLCSK